MNCLTLLLSLVSSPWHFGLNSGWAAGLYAIDVENVDYTNANSGCHVVGVRPAIAPPGFFHLALSLEDERSIGFATSLETHYKTYRATAHIEKIPYYPLPVDATQDIPYVHVQWAWGVQKTLSVAEGRVLFPLGLSLTNNWIIPAATQDMVEEYINTLSLNDIEKLVNDYTMAIDSIIEKPMGVRLNLGLDVAIVKTPGFSWLAGMGLDWNILFKKTANDVGFYPVFGLRTGFRF